MSRVGTLIIESRCVGVVCPVWSFLIVYIVADSFINSQHGCRCYTVDFRYTIVKSVPRFYFKFSRRGAPVPKVIRMNYINRQFARSSVKTLDWIRNSPSHHPALGAIFNEYCHNTRRTFVTNTSQLLYTSSKWFHWWKHEKYNTRKNSVILIL